MKITPYKTVLEVQALLSEGFNPTEIRDKLALEGKKIGRNTVYAIKRGEYQPPTAGKNAWYTGKRVENTKKTVEEELEKYKTDVIARTSAIEQIADLESLKRLITPELRTQLSARDLVAFADSAAKRNALAKGQPTEIFDFFDKNMTPTDIIELLNLKPDNDEDQHKELDSGSAPGNPETSQELSRA